MRPWTILAGGGLVLALATAWAGMRLPSGDVPIQFGVDGAVNRTGAPGDVLTALLVLGLVLLALGVGLVLLARHGPLRMLNIPHRDYWLAPQREPEVRRMISEDMALAIGATLVFLALIPVWIVLGAEGGAEALSPLVFWTPIGAFLIGIAMWSVWLGRRRYRPPPAG